mmetsp:Transcript_41259/g.97043  ORF Transcript_41259/g.97043 Transcript_41259/m.97043 type:complete len:266 (+) Transcript_41259:191-988(+)
MFPAANDRGEPKHLSAKVLRVAHEPAHKGKLAARAPELLPATPKVIRHPCQGRRARRPPACTVGSAPLARAQREPGHLASIFPRTSLFRLVKRRVAHQIVKLIAGPDDPVQDPEAVRLCAHLGGLKRRVLSAVGIAEMLGGGSRGAVTFAAHTRPAVRRRGEQRVDEAGACADIKTAHCIAARRLAMHGIGGEDIGHEMAMQGRAGWVQAGSEGTRTRRRLTHARRGRCCTHARTHSLRGRGRAGRARRGAGPRSRRSPRQVALC